MAAPLWLVLPLLLVLTAPNSLWLPTQLLLWYNIALVLYVVHSAKDGSSDSQRTH